jgi:hypothetical protein
MGHFCQAPKEHPLVAGLLPFSKRPDQVNICFGRAETAGFAVW